SSGRPASLRMKTPSHAAMCSVSSQMLCAFVNGLAAAWRAVTSDRISFNEGPCQASPSWLNVAHGRVRLGAGEENFVWEWTDTKNALDQMLWRIADSAAEMLTTDDLTRLRECPGEDCGWLFLDTSKNSRRQWCDMQTCGNLAKVRRFRRRQQP
ncbi:MAG: CGNR zinc finger domain-containing protein, partial [Blastocatellia bacterium]